LFLSKKQQRSDAKGPASSFQARERPAQRQRKAEESHEEPRHPTQPGRSDTVGQKSDSAFAEIAQSQEARFFSCWDIGSCGQIVECEAGGVLLLSRQNCT